MAIPWFQIVQWVPQIVSLSKELLQQSKTARRGDSRSDDERLADLEERERKHAELVARMAQQLAAMAEVVTALRKQLLMLRIISLASLLAAAVALAMAAT